MADPPSYSDPGEDAGTPRWVKVSGIVLVVLALLFVILVLTGRGLGGHGPGRHTSPSGFAAPGLR